MADRHDFVEGTPVWVGAVAAGSGRCTWSLGRVSRVDGRRVLVETRGADVAFLSQFPTENEVL